MGFAVQPEVEALRRLVAAERGAGRQFDDRLERIPVAVLVADDEGRFIAANRHASALTGYTRDELRERSVADITEAADLSDQERLWRSFERDRNRYQRGHYVLRRKDGSGARVRYEAFWDLGPGIHISFLEPESGA